MAAAEGLVVHAAAWATGSMGDRIHPQVDPSTNSPHRQRLTHEIWSLVLVVVWIGRLAHETRLVPPFVDWD